MVSRRFVLIGFILFSAAGALAFLPPDASEREPEIRAHRIQVQKEYEKRIEERRELIAREYEKATAAIGIPPWEMDRVLNGKSEKDVQAEIEQVQTVKKKVRKQFLVSIVLLIIIGSGVGWVKHKTHEVES